MITMADALHVRLEGEIVSIVDEIAKAQNVSVGDFVRQALEKYLNDFEDELDGQEAERILRDPETRWFTLDEVRADLER